MKKLLLLMIFGIYMLTGCNKKEEQLKLEFVDSVVRVESCFTDTVIEFNLNISDLVDGESRYNYFYSTKTYEELKNEFKNNEYYVGDDDNCRFFKEDTYFHLRLIKEFDGYSEYCIACEDVMLAVENEIFVSIPFMKEFFPRITVGTDYNVSKDYVINYYNRLPYDYIEVTNERIILKDRYNTLKEKKYNIFINLLNDSLNITCEEVNIND